MIATKELSKQVGVSRRYIRKLLLNAQRQDKNWINLNGERFDFKIVSKIELGGKGYMLTPAQAKKPKRKKVPNSIIRISELPKVQNLSKFTVAEKLAVVQYYLSHSIPIKHLVKALLMDHKSDLKAASLQRNIERWVSEFKNDGKGGFEDKRGGKAFKADIDAVQLALLGCGSRHYLTAYNFYCYQYNKKHDLAHDMRNPVSDISYRSFVRSCEHLKKTNQLVRDYLRNGMDAFEYAEPSFGNEWTHPNEQWEIDATKKDIMVKVPHTKGIREYTARQASDTYHLVRMQVIGVIDNFTGATIYSLHDSSNSYSNVRLLKKALMKLGKPELIKGDNGKDFLSKHFQSVLTDLGITYISTSKGRGDEKGKIERSFKTLQHSPEFESMAGFVGHSVAQRQQLENQASTTLEQLSGVQTNLETDNAMWWWEAENWLDNFMQAKQKEKYELHPADISDTAEITRLLGKRFTKKISKQGIRHNNQHYTSYEMWNKVSIGDTVEVIENIDDSNSLYLYDKYLKFIGEIEDVSMLRKSQTVEQVRSSKKAYKQRVVKEIKHATKRARKDFKGYQNVVRDEYLDILPAQLKRPTNQKQTSKKELLDYYEETMLRVS